jgi:Tol biopolymer transport system component
MYMVSADGGTPRELIPDESQDEWDPSWSADGTKLAFGGGSSNANNVIRVLDLKTNQISTLPGSNGFFSPRWSPDGRYITAMPFDSRGLMLFDVATEKWEEVAKLSLAFPNWSKNSDYVYFLHEANEPSVMRVHIRDGKIERVADLKDFTQIGYFGIWLGIAPDDSPLLLRDTGAQEVYALDWEAQ